MKKRTFSFYSISCPDDFLSRLSESAKQADLALETSENELRLNILSHHGGQVYYCAKVSGGENGGTVVEGEIITVPWNQSENKTKLQKVMGALGYTLGAIALSPLILLIFLCFGFYELFLLIKNKGKIIRARPKDEEMLSDFMLNKMCCKQL